MDKRKTILKISIKLYSLHFYIEVELCIVQFDEKDLLFVHRFFLWLTSLKFHFVTSMHYLSKRKLFFKAFLCSTLYIYKIIFH